jgi:hypothetical protein
MIPIPTAMTMPITIQIGARWLSAPAFAKRPDQPDDEDDTH